MYCLRVVFQENYMSQNYVTGSQNRDWLNGIICAIYTSMKNTLKLHIVTWMLMIL